MLTLATAIARHIVICVTSDEYVQRSGKRHPVEHFEVRAIRALLYCAGRLPLGCKITLVPIDDPYGPAVSDPEADSIIVSEETAARVFEINKIRLERGLEPLAVVIVPIVRTHDRRKLSTSLIYTIGV